MLRESGRKGKWSLDVLLPVNFVNLTREAKEKGV